MSPRKPSPVTLHVLVFLGLLVLLAATVGVAYLSLGRWGVVAALGIAFAKAALVMVFFMQLRENSPLVRVFAIGGFFWLALLFLLTFADILTRGTPL